VSTVPLCFIDTETTGLRRPWQTCGRQIWEVAMIRRDPTGAEEHKVLRLTDRWVDFKKADPFALQIGHYWDRRADETVSESIIADEVWRMTAGCHLVGAVPSFDEESLAHLLNKNDKMPRWHYHLIDVENLAAGALGLEPPYKSDDLFAAFGVNIPEEERHTAMGDARSAMALYDAVMRAERRIERRVG